MSSLVETERQVGERERERQTHVMELHLGEYIKSTIILHVGKS